MKKYIIVKPNCRELANHLWNYMSIYAYGLETEARVYNPAFFEWHRYFNLRGRKMCIRKMLLSLYGSYLIRVRARCVQLTLGITTYLPPTKPLIGGDACETTYFIGWHFRNPVGLARHRDALITAFMPKERILKKIEDVLTTLYGKRLIGVHLRQQPYKGFPDGDFLVPISRTRRIVEEYLREQKLDVKDVALIVVSDKNIGSATFGSFTTYVSREDEVVNLFLLSKCSIVIGSNSTFANLAAWFGNVPHIVVLNESVDWDYYRNRQKYFENKYATFAQ